MKKNSHQFVETGKQFKKSNLDPDLSFRKRNQHFRCLHTLYSLQLSAVAMKAQWQLLRLDLLYPCQKVKLFIYQATHLCLMQKHKEIC